MLTLRCTRTLLTRLRAAPATTDGAAAPPVLGDWYAHLLPVRPQLVLFVAQATLLPVVVPAAPLHALVPRFLLAARAVLLDVGVPEAAADDELARMQPVAVAKTQSRQLLGVVSDFAHLLGARRPGASLHAESLFLARTPCSPLRMETPQEATCARLAR